MTPPPDPSATPAAASLELALETSTRTPSLALRSGGALFERELSPERAHASDLFTALDELLRQARRDPGELELVAVGLGPGSFTGLRVGAATALGLARGAGAALRAEPSFEALAWGRLEPGETGRVLLDARSRSFYCALYRREDADVVAAEAPRLVAPEELADLALRDDAAATPPRWFADAAARTALREHASRVPRRCAEAEDVLPRASALLALAGARLARDGAHAAERAEPLYLRDFAVRPRKR